MNYWVNFINRIFAPDPDAIAAYRTVLPDNLHVSVKKDGDIFIAKVDKVGKTKIKGLLITEAKDLDTLISNVNDLVYTYVNMPTRIRPYYGELFTPRDLDRSKKVKELVLVKA